MSTMLHDDGESARAQLVLVRHCESLWNAAGRIQGHGGPGLSARGKLEARALSAALARRFAAAKLIISSDLVRARETAEAVAEALPHADLELDARLREIDVGSWTGRTYAEVEREDPITTGAWLRGDDVRCGGGESHGELLQRTAQALAMAVERARREAPRGTVIVVSHGGPIRLSIAQLLGLHAGAYRRLSPLRNASMCVAQAFPGAGSGLTGYLESYNEVTHLGPDYLGTGLEEARDGKSS